MQTIAAIDVGSNAIRMVVGRVNHTEEVEAIDNIRLIRYHRKTASTNQDEQFKALAQKDRLIVTKLCALVRLADALEVSHTARIRDLTMKKAKGCWQLKMVGQGNLLRERWALGKRKARFEEVFGTRLEILE